MISPGFGAWCNRVSLLLPGVSHKPKIFDLLLLKHFRPVQCEVMWDAMEAEASGFGSLCDIVSLLLHS